MGIIKDMNNKDYKSISFADMPTQFNTEKSPIRNQNKSFYITQSVKSYYSCLLKDIEVRKLSTRDKLADKNISKTITKPTDLEAAAYQKIHTNGSITSLDGENLAKILAEIDKHKLYISSNSGLQIAKTSFRLDQLKWNPRGQNAYSHSKVPKSGPHVLVIDCRFPYEFRGGHVKGAINISDPKVLEFLFIENHQLFRNNEFLQYLSTFQNTGLNSVKSETLVSSFKKYMVDSQARNKRTKKVKAQISSKKLYTSWLTNSVVDANNSTLARLNAKRDDTSIDKEGVMQAETKAESSNSRFNISCNKNVKSSDTDLTLILYCEFSSKRAPDMFNHLRKLDRQANAVSYPNLYYNNLYLLENGYSGYVKKFRQFCTGEGHKYIKMSDPKFETEYKKSTTLLARQWERYVKTPSTSRTNLKHNLKALSFGENKLFS